MSDVLRILFVGPQPPPIGGATVLSKQLFEFLRVQPDVDVMLVDSARGSGPIVRRLWARMRVPIAMARRIGRSDVVLVNLSVDGLRSLGVVATVLSRIVRRPIILRRFGGSDLLGSGAFRRSVEKWTLRRVTMVFTETRALVSQGEQIEGVEVRWLPNSRPLPLDRSPLVRIDRAVVRFVFIGQIRSDKGMRELIEASERLESAHTIDVYGPLGFDVERRELTTGSVEYRGALPPHDVQSVLRDYDVLVLPTYYQGEGYPGIVLEAFGAGVPVVVTRWRSIPELVDESCGVLVEPHDVSDLLRGMRVLADDPQRLAAMAKAAHRRAADFDSAYWDARVLEACRRASLKHG